MTKRPAAQDTIFTALPGNVRQLMAATGYAQSTVQWHLCGLHASGRIYIDEWVRCPTGQALAVYAVGEGVPDAPVATCADMAT